MDAFEFLFGLFSLLIGLCIAELFGGLGRCFEARKTCSTGWLTPLLGIFLIGDLSGVWLLLWEARAHIPMNGLVLLAGFLWAGGYYLAAYIVFPRVLAPGCDMDEHFFGVRRLVLGISAATTVLVGFSDSLITGVAKPSDTILTISLFLPAYALAIIPRRKLLVASGLVMLLLINLLGIITHTVNVQT